MTLNKKIALHIEIFPHTKNIIITSYFITFLFLCSILHQVLRLHNFKKITDSTSHRLRRIKINYNIFLIVLTIASLHNTFEV